jgi:predicted Zn-dependent protease
MSLRLTSRLFALLGLAVVPLLSACETAPATGRTIFTGGLSAEDEIRLGYQEHQKILPQFGGAYADPALAGYLSSIGNLLARTSETPGTKFTFTLLDTPIVNAFALPGGYVYITRGLLALADNEAEVAGVLAHEIGHVTARHSAERHGQTVAASVFGLGLGLLLGRGPATDLYGGVAAVALRSYSREQEYESDLLGVRYMTRAGYDPGAMASFLSRLQAHGRFESELRGEPGKADQFDILRTHPRTADRIARAIQEAGARSVADPMTARDLYLDRIDGLLFGDNPKQGLVRGRRFLHPELRIAFEVPQGYRLFNGARRVTARGPEGAVIAFEKAKQAVRGPMTAYLTQVWAKGVALNEVERLTVNGMEAATGLARGHGQAQGHGRGGAIELRLVAIRYDAATIYHMIFVTPARLAGPLARGLRETTYSFRALSAAEAARLTPYRLRIHRSGAGETAARIAARMPFEDHHLRRFLVLNGLNRDQSFPTGHRVKTVTE